MYHHMPPIRMATYGKNPSTLHTPHHATQATYVSACTSPSILIRATDGYELKTWAQTAVRCCIQNRDASDLSWDAGAYHGRREIGRYVCSSCEVVWGKVNKYVRCEVEGGGDRREGLHSYCGQRVRIRPAIGKKTTKTVENHAE